MSHHYHGPKDRTSPWMYVPLAIVSTAVVAAVFASGFLQGRIAGLEAPEPEVAVDPSRPAVNVQALAEPTPELVRAGRQLYAVNCASCHGPDGYGDGAQGRGLNPPVRNFHENSDWKNGASVLGMWTTLQEGIAGSSMAAYRVMPAEDRMAIIHYIRESMMDDPPELTSDEIAQLPAGGGVATAQSWEDVLVLDLPDNPLPIDFAMARLAQEAAERDGNP